MSIHPSAFGSSKIPLHWGKKEFYGQRTSRMPMKLYDLLAEILEYPTPSLHECFDECMSLLFPSHQRAFKLLKGFESFLAQTPTSQIEEIYTRTFDLQAICFPYVGHYLFGEDHRRGMFMAKLKEKHRLHDFYAGNELPDHLAVMIRFLARMEDGEENEELVRECVIPCLERMIQGFKDRDNPYKAVMQALWLILKEAQREDGQMGRGGADDGE
jgi:nitrate reductase delta subunit